ncbi:MAG TPA: pyridoxal-phosphate dependent enzyme [Thermoanaerobaculia bacterium]|nr:pyridoxal-phosphate dependent enzyme [Thermoanaerobaculia bacterium]
MEPLAPPALEEIRAAERRLRGFCLRTPLLRLESDGPSEISLKLENLQPIGSFKLRGAGNAIAVASPDSLARGVSTASAGNMAQGVAWNARRLGIPCTVVVPDHAPRAKLDAVERLGGRFIKLPVDRWWQVLVDHGYPGLEGLFVHPVADPAVVAGNGTIGLEIVEELPDVDAVLVPWGGGGLSCGIAAAVRALRPAARVFACEVETAAPLSASLAAGRPVGVDFVPSFVDGIGARGLLPEMWPMAQELLAGSLVVSLAETAAALRRLASRARVVAEGAGAVPVAAALAHGELGRRVVCVVSGGNIDADRLAAILAEAT